MARAKRILVVDDEPDVVALLVEVLRRRGLDAEGLTDATEAESTVVRRKPDLVLLDYDMPKMLGPDVALALKSRPETAAIPILFLSGMADEDHQVIGRASGGVGYLTKPCDERTLLEAVMGLLGAP